MSNTSTTAPPVSPIGAGVQLPSFDDTLGCMLIAVVFISILYGITTVQSFIYYQTSQRDSLALRLTVLALWIIDGVQLGIGTHILYYYTVTNFANLAALLTTPWSYAAYSLVCGIGNIIVIFLFARRVWKMTEGAKWLAILIGIPAIASFAGNTMICAFSFIEPSFAAFNEKYEWVWYMAFSTQALADVTICASLAVTLIKKRTGFKNTDSVIRMIIVFSVNTCFITSAAGIATVVLYATKPDALYHVALGAVVPKLMLNACLGMLNTRDIFFGKLYGSGDPLSINLSNLPSETSSGLRFANSETAYGDSAPSYKIRVQKEVESK